MTETVAPDAPEAPAATETPAAPDAPDAPQAPAEPGPGRGRTVLTVAVLTAVVAAPIAIAAAAVRSPRWYPLVDLAQIEMRVRDVGLAHPPLLGLGGRIFGYGTQGSHPGPLSFYLLAPVYRLAGSSSWALNLSDAVINVAVVAAILWVAHRRAGLRGALALAAGLAFLMRLYSTAVLVYPWNPYMPVLFWVLFLVCVWSVLCDDVALLPVAVFAGSLCAQTHVPYVALVGGMSVVVVGGLAWSWRGRRDDAGARRALVRWTGASVALGALLWLPVFVEQLGGNPGNLSIIIASFRHPSEPPIGLGQAGRLWLHHLDVVNIARGSDALSGSLVPGVALAALWAAAAAVAVLVVRQRTLTALHVVAGSALALGLVAISRIFGPAWDYLMLWAWGTAALAAVAVILTGLALVDRGLGAGTASRLSWAPAAALGVLVLVPTVLAARSAPDTEESAMALSNDLGRVVAPTLAAIDGGDVPGPGGHDGTYLVTWTDAYNLGGQGQGLLLELERRGYDARADRGQKIALRAHRLIDPADADAELHLAVGGAAIDEAAAHPGSRRIAYVDPRTAAQRADYEQARDEVVAGLERAGLDDMLRDLDSNFFGVAADPRLPEELRVPVYVMGQVRQPIAVFTWDPNA